MHMKDPIVFWQCEFALTRFKIYSENPTFMFENKFETNVYTCRHYQYRTLKRWWRNWYRTRQCPHNRLDPYQYLGIHDYIHIRNYHQYHDTFHQSGNRASFESIHWY